MPTCLISSRILVVFMSWRHCHTSDRLLPAILLNSAHVLRHSIAYEPANKLVFVLIVTNSGFLQISTVVSGAGPVGCYCTFCDVSCAEPVFEEL
jgi:hypothetical protein